MKDSIVNLLVFLVVFALSAAVLLGLYGLSLVLIPGGRGLIFASPYAGTLLPALLAALTVAQTRSVQRPGVFRATWLLQLAAFYLLLTLPVPWIENLPPVRSSDETPLHDRRFLFLQDGSQLLSAGRTSVLIPADGSPMTVSGETQYDSLHDRFVFSSEEPRAVAEMSPERSYFQFTPALVSFETDLLGVYSKLTQPSHPLLSLVESLVISWLFLGGYLMFSLRTWSLVRVVALMVLVRLELVFVVYSLWSLPSLVRLWIPQSTLLADWSPVVLIGLAASTLFFMTILAKPHRAERLQ